MENRSATICICKGAGKLDFLFCLLYNKSIYPLAAAILFDMLLNKVLTRIPMREVAKKLMWLPNSTGVVVITEENAVILVQLNNCLAVE